MRPGSVRVESNEVAGLPNVAFLNRTGARVLIVLNDSESEKAFFIKFGDTAAKAKLMGGAVGTFVF